MMKNVRFDDEFEERNKHGHENRHKSRIIFFY